MKIYKNITKLVSILTSEKFQRALNKKLSRDKVNTFLLAQGFKIKNFTEKQKYRLFSYAMNKGRRGNCLGLISKSSEDCKICILTKECKKCFKQVLIGDFQANPIVSQVFPEYKEKIFC